MKKMILFWSVFVLLFVGGCGYNSGALTPEKRAYLYFTGATEGVEVSIDNGPTFAVKKGEENHYKLKPGMHSVKIYRDGDMIVERQIYLGDGIAKEIEVR